MTMFEVFYQFKKVHWSWSVTFVSRKCNH